MIINRISIQNIYLKQNFQNIKTNYIQKNQDTISFSGKRDKDTRPLIERFLYTIGISHTSTPLHEAKNEEETKKILAPIKRDKELRDILLYDDENWSRPIHLAKSAEQSKVLLEASPNEKVLIKQLLSEDGEGETPLHLARNAEQSKTLLSAAPSEEIQIKQLLFKDKEKYIPLHYAQSTEQINTLLDASPDIETKVMQLTAKACDGSLPIHMAKGNKLKETLLNASPNDRVKFEQLIAIDDEGNPPCDASDDICVKIAYELATTSDQLTDIEKDVLLTTYVNFVKDPYFTEIYMKEYNKSIKEFLDSLNQ